MTTAASAPAPKSNEATLPKLAPAIVHLSKLLNVDVDSMDPKVAKNLIALGVQPVDQTSNQILVGDGILDPDNAEMLKKTIAEVCDKGWEAVYDRMSVLLCLKNLPNISGRVLLQTSPSQAYDTDKIVDHARRYAAEFERAGISKDRFCIKIPATGPGMNAGPILLAEGIRTLGTSLFSVPQAIASSQAGCLYISPYFNEVKAHDPATGLFPNVRDPAVEHPMSPRMVQIYEAYRELEAKTGKTQPLIKGASNITAQEVLAVAEMGAQHCTILEPVLKQLCELQVLIPNAPQPKNVGYSRALSPRMLSLLNTDPLAPKFTKFDVETDYLKNQGEELEKAIREDPECEKRLKDALELFIGAEQRAKEAILAAM